jgi:hypothetical protein
MDQLKVVLEQKFWILAGLALLLPPIGWWAATDDLAKETDSRTKKIESAEKKIPDGSKFPNEKWIKGAEEIDREIVATVTQSWAHLFDHQKSEMTWPPIVQEYMDKSKVKYRGDGQTNPDFMDAREFFVQKYLEDWKRTVNIIKPFKVSTGEGLILLADDQGQDSPISRHFEVEQWRQTLVFAAKDMWDVQEDIWFLRSLMKAIARVNEGTTELGNSRIRKLTEATLRGGDPADLANRQKGAGASNQPGTSRPRAPSMGGGLGGFGAFAGAAAGVDASFKPPKGFDPDDIFGDDGSKANMTDTRGGKFKEGNAAPADARRYVNSTPKYDKRGFVLRLVMDEREIPTLLASLTESAFPVQILHVEHSVHVGNAGTDASRLMTEVTTNTNPDGTEQLTREQQARQRKIIDGVRMAFNMHYLADVTVAGTFTIYKEPQSGKKPSSGSGDAKPALANATPANGSTGPAKGSAAVGTASKAPAATSKAASSPTTAAARGAAATQATKAGSPAAANKTTAPSAASKTTLPASGSRPAAK